LKHATAYADLKCFTIQITLFEVLQCEVNYTKIITSVLNSLNWH